MMNIFRYLQQLNKFTLPVTAEEFRQLLVKHIVLPPYDPAEAFKKYPIEFKGPLEDGKFLLRERRKFGYNTGILLNVAEHHGTFQSIENETSLQITTKPTEGFLILFILQLVAITLYMCSLISDSDVQEVIFILILYFAVIGLFWFFIRSKIEMGAENFVKEVNYIIYKNKKGNP